MREKWNPSVVRTITPARPPSPAEVELIMKLDLKAAHDIQTCMRETVDRICPRCSRVYKQPLSCGSWACWRCADRRTNNNTDWVVFKIYEVIQAIRRKTGRDYAGPFWQFEGTAPSGSYQYRIARKGMGLWKRFNSDFFHDYLVSQKPRLWGLELGMYVYGQNWRSSDPLGVGPESKKYGSAYHYHTHGFVSGFGWEKSTGRLYTVEYPESEMWIESRYEGLGDFGFRTLRLTWDEALSGMYGLHSASDVDFNVKYRPNESRTEHRNWYSGRSPIWDIHNVLADAKSLPSGLHTEAKSYLHSLLMTRNFKRYSGYGLYSSYYWQRRSLWLRFLGLELPHRARFEREIRIPRCHEDGEPLGIDMRTVAPIERALDEGSLALFRPSTRAFKRKLGRKYRGGS